MMNSRLRSPKLVTPPAVSGQSKKIQDQISEIYKKTFFIKNQEKLILQITKDKDELINELTKLSNHGKNQLGTMQTDKIESFYEKEYLRHQSLIKKLAQRIFDLENEDRQYKELDED